MSWVLGGVAASTLTALAASVGAAIVLLYVLRLRRRRIAVPYLELWRRVLGDGRSAQLRRRLRRLLGLLVHLAVLALLLLALGDPRRAGALRDARSVVIVVDTSASMAARDEAGHRTRIDRAREEARDTIRRLGPRDEVMVVAADGRLRPLTPFVRNFGIAEEAVSTIEASAAPLDPRPALDFAYQALADRAHGTVVFISDAAFPDRQRLDDADRPRGVTLVHRAVGTRNGNVGITAFNVRRYPSNRTNYEVYVRLENFADQAVTVQLEITGGGNIVHSETLDLSADGAATRIYPDIPAAGRHLEARVHIAAGDVIDDLPLDDVAHALLPDRRPIRVLLVTPGNLYLEAPFLLNESLEVVTISPDAYVAPNAGDPSAGYDVTVFDRVAPPIADRGNFLFVSPSGPDSPWRVASDVVDPIIHSTVRGHPLMHWISGLRDVNVARARHLRTTADDRVIASAIGGAPMIVARETPSRRLVGLAFDIADTDLPLRIAWPVFLLNAVDWFTRDSASLVEAFRTGQTWTVPIGDREVDQVSVTSPSGRTFTAVSRGGSAVFYGDEIGVWTIDVGDRSVFVAGNLANPDESRIGPGEAAETLGDGAVAELPDHGVERSAEPWMLLVGIAFLLVVLEWVTWNRRVTV